MSCGVPTSAVSGEVDLWAMPPGEVTDAELRATYEAKRQVYKSDLLACFVTLLTVSRAWAVRSPEPAEWSGMRVPFGVFVDLVERLRDCAMERPLSTFDAVVDAARAQAHLGRTASISIGDPVRVHTHSLARTVYILTEAARLGLPAPVGTVAWNELIDTKVPVASARGLPPGIAPPSAT